MDEPKEPSAEDEAHAVAIELVGQRKGDPQPPWNNPRLGHIRTSSTSTVHPSAAQPRSGASAPSGECPKPSEIDLTVA